MTSMTIAPTACIEITDPRERLAFIPQLFFTAQGDQLVAAWFAAHSQYTGGFWRYFTVPRGICGRIAGWTEDCITRPTGYVVPPEGLYHISIASNYFEAEVSERPPGSLQP